MKATESLLKKLNNIPSGVVFDYKELEIPGDMILASAKVLSRLVEQNKLKKVGKGRFYKPVYSRLGVASPLMYELAKDLLLKGDKIIGYITGMPIFAQMGLTTQISSKILIGSNSYRRPLVRGGYEISFTLQKNDITEDTIPLLRLLDAVRFIKKIPACTPDDAVGILLKKISSLTENERNRLIGLSLAYSPATRALLGGMLENCGVESSVLRSSINPLSKFKIGISENILPEKSNWNLE